MAFPSNNIFQWVGARAADLYTRLSIRWLRGALPKSFERLSLGQESVPAFTRAIRDSATTLTSLTLTADACYRLMHCTADEAAAFTEAVQALCGPVQVTITGAHTDLEDPVLPDFPNIPMPSIFPRLNGSNCVLGAARILLQGASIASVQLPPISLFNCNARTQSYWGMLMDVFSNPSARLRLSDLLLDLSVLDAQVTDKFAIRDMTGDEMRSAFALLTAQLSRHAVSTLCMYIGAGTFIESLHYLQAWSVQHLRIMDTFNSNLDVEDNATMGIHVANNLGIRSLEVYQGETRYCPLSDLDGSFDTFIGVAMDNPEHEFPDGVRLFRRGCASQPAKLTCLWLDDRLSRLRLGRALVLDLHDVKWQCSTIHAVNQALANNPDVRHLKLTVLLLSDPTYQEHPPQVGWLDLPPHVTSLYVTVDSVTYIRLFVNASLLGLDDLAITFTDASYVSCTLGLNSIMYRVLHGATNLRRLRLSCHATFNSVKQIIHVMNWALPPACEVKLTVFATDDAAWAPLILAQVVWDVEIHPNLGSYIAKRTLDC